MHEARGRVRLVAGQSRVLTDNEIYLVQQLLPSGVVLAPAHGGGTVTKRFDELSTVQDATDGRTDAIFGALSPRWESLSASAQRTATGRLEVVLEILTGYRYGFAALACSGEPREAFSPTRTLTQRATSMARQLRLEKDLDRDHVIRVARGELLDRSPGVTTLLNWVRAYRAEGLWGLVDSRATRVSAGDAALPDLFKELANAEFRLLDGDISTVNVRTMEERIQRRAQAQGKTLDYPQRRGQKYLSALMSERGRGTRAQRSRSMRDTAGYQHYPAMRPGQVVAIDATRADVLVWDDLHERSFSVEILTALDVATRCVLGLRVVPKSASAIDASLLLYDVMRPFQLHVDGSTITDWRWAGIPEAVDFNCEGLHEAPLDGTHSIPSVHPDAIRCDHGTIFVGEHFTRLLNDLGIDLMLSRGTRPTDNTHVERWHETLQRALQDLPGYKGRSPFERGRLVGRSDNERGQKLLTATELERFLRAWVALDYHRTPHSGLVISGATNARHTPLSMFDALTSITGRLDVAQSPDLVYQFLPIRWATIRHDGVRIANLTYDDAVLNEFRHLQPGAFRNEDRAAPFFVDPRDLSRVWFRHPATGQVHPINWRGAWRLNAPLTQTVLQRVREQVRARGGNAALGRRGATDEIIRSLNSLMAAQASVADKAMWSAARVRVDASQRDHLEAQLALYSRERVTAQMPESPPPVSESVTVVEQPAPEESPIAIRSENNDAGSAVLATAWAQLNGLSAAAPGPDESSDEAAGW